MKIEYSTLIQRPLGEVFAFVTCYENDPEWSTIIVESAQTTPGSVKVGTRVRRSARIMGRKLASNAEIVEFTRNAKSCLKSISGAVPQLETRLFQSVENGTLLTFVVEGELANLFKLNKNTLARVLQRQIETDLDNLKDLLEDCG